MVDCPEQRAGGRGVAVDRFKYVDAVDRFKYVDAVDRYKHVDAVDNAEQWPLMSASR